MLGDPILVDIVLYIAYTYIHKVILFDCFLMPLAQVSDAHPGRTWL